MKRKVSNLLMLTLALTSVLMTAITVNAKPSYGAMALDRGGPVHPEYGSPGWSGPITGDINGYMYFFNTGKKDAGQAHHFWEIWLITDGNGIEYGNTLLMGTDNGVVTWKNDKYRMNGVVTEANGDYEHLFGRNVHMSGIITFDPDTGAPLTAPGTFRVN